MRKPHPGHNLGNFLHPKKTNPLAERMKPHVAPVKQTKPDTKPAPVKMAPMRKMMPGKMMAGKGSKK